MTAAQQATILAVDDEENVLASLRRLFRPTGWRVRVASGGAAGLAVLENEPVDVVISDMRMPGMDGAAFLGEVARRWPASYRILLTAYADLDSTIAAVNRGQIHQYLAKPWEEAQLKLLVRNALERRRLEREREALAAQVARQNETLRALNAELETRVAARSAELEQTVAFLEHAHEALRQSYQTAIEVFASLIELRARPLAGHARRVAELASALGERLGLSPHERQDLRHAALLHDIGKIGLPDALLRRSFEGLDASERAEVVKHPALGAAVLLGLEPLRGAATLIRHHHERYDGQGYPDGLAGEAIPLGARVLAVANDYDALQLGTLAARKLTAHEAREFLLTGRGRRYDPVVVDALCALLGEVSVPLRERGLESGALRPGMVLTRDLLIGDGVLLLARGQRLDQERIDSIRRFERHIGSGLIFYVRNGEDPTWHAS